MKTTITGTLDEWLKHDPDAMLINRKIKFMSNGCYVSPLPVEKDPKQVTYDTAQRPDDYIDYGDPFFFCRSFCSYKVTAKHKFFVSVNTIYSSGVPMYPICKAHWEDPNWEKIDRPEDSLVIK